MKVIFLGFNKTATQTIHNLFVKNGIESIHWKDDSSGKNLATEMAKSISQKKPILTEFERFKVFSDLTFLSYAHVIEGNAFFRELSSDYPDALFCLNTRPVDDWILSRLRWGNFAERYSNCLRLSIPELVIYWKELKEEREREIREFFSGHSNFLEFSISNEFPNLFSFLDSKGIVLENRDLDWANSVTTHKKSH